MMYKIIEFVIRSIIFYDFCEIHFLTKKIVTNLLSIIFFFKVIFNFYLNYVLDTTVVILIAEFNYKNQFFFIYT